MDIMVNCEQAEGRALASQSSFGRISPSTRECQWAPSIRSEADLSIEARSVDRGSLGRISQGPQYRGLALEFTILLKKGA
jgi:hypothetical protein